MKSPKTEGLSNRRVFADLRDAAPDGSCLDTDGAVWVAVLNQDNFIPMLESGEITHRVRVMDRFPVAGTLGGLDGRTLFGLTYQGSIQDIGKGKAASRIEMAGGYARGWFLLRAVSISAGKNTKPIKWPPDTKSNP